LKKNKKNK